MTVFPRSALNLGAICCFLVLLFSGCAAHGEKTVSPPEDSAARQAKAGAPLQGEADFAPGLPLGEALVRTGQICTPRPGVKAAPNAVICNDVLSPKSVNFTADGKRIYINALEGFTTLVYSFPDLKQEAVIRHTFTKADASLFQGENTVFGYAYYRKSPAGDPNVFSGKPVEAAFSHQGKYLWVPYYRRDFDGNASSPSAVAIIDTRTNKIVRVMPTGPLPKVVAVSPDNRLVAITHWGDNTVGLIDISSSNPAEFAYTKHLVVGRQMGTAGLSGDRDSNCGYCLRGTVFSPDSKYLLVGRMGGGGITCFSMPDGKLLGTFTAFCERPRHLALDPAGRYLYASNNRQGTVSRVLLADALEAVRGANGGSVAGPKGESLRVGPGARTIAISPDGKNLYAAINNSSELLQVDLGSWSIVRRVPVSPFAVGLGISPDGAHVAVTSQGKGEFTGGNSVEIFRTTPGSK